MLLFTDAREESDTSDQLSVIFTIGLDVGARVQGIPVLLTGTFRFSETDLCND